jgi:hypothetical protein
MDAETEADRELTAVRYLQSIYRDPMEPTGVRMRAAKEAAPYENPKLSAVMSSQMDQRSFAAALDRALERSKTPYVSKPALLPPAEQQPASELRKPFSFPRRNLR